MMRSFHYMNQSSCIDVPTEDDVTNWHMIAIAAKSFAQGNLVTINDGEHEGASGELEYPHLKLKDEVRYKVAVDGVKGSLSLLGEQLDLSGISVDELMQVLAGILHLGEINFVAIEEKGMEATEVQDPTPAKRAARFFGIGEEGCDWEKIGGNESVFTRVKMFGTFQYETAVQACSQRDSMSKAIFEKLFHWLMETVNKSLRMKDSKDVEAATIGILDIFGFEIGTHNSFEQLCINYCNEKLQQQFIHFIFTKEAEFYEAEGIPFKKTEFKDNSEMLDLIEKQNGGLFRTLDDQSMSKQGSDKKFFEKFAQANRLPPNDQYLTLPKPLRRGGKEWQRMGETERNGYENSFQLMHYASVVTYDSRGFVQKNGDKMSQNLLPMLRDSHNPFIASLFKEAPERDSLGKKFKTQLHTLIGTVHYTPYTIHHAPYTILILHTLIGTLQHALYTIHCTHCTP
jgi:myosin heavy subunit